MPRMTPMMQQYNQIKNNYRDYILLFRMGDFYEMFYDDAKTASEVLGIALTSRDKNKEGAVPLAGIPCKSADGYIAKLIRAGFGVAVCEQTGSVEEAKGLVDRRVVEVITSGTVLSPALLDGTANNFIASVAVESEKAGIAISDVSTGQFMIGAVPLGSVALELERFSPTELIVCGSASGFPGLSSIQELLPGIRITETGAAVADGAKAARILAEQFGPASLSSRRFQRVALAAGAELLAYLKKLRGESLPHLTELEEYQARRYMTVDKKTCRNLELLSPLTAEGHSRTLFDILNRTVTPMGSRMLRGAILRPLLDVDQITLRLGAVSELVESPPVLAKLRGELSGISDLERLSARIACGKTTPRDLGELRKSIGRIPDVKTRTAELASVKFADIAGRMDELRDLHSALADGLVEDPPVHVSDGGVIRAGYDQELDLLRSTLVEARERIASIEIRERERTGIGGLRVGYSRVFGYYLEVTKSYSSAVPEDYVRKQTLAGAERYETPELKEVEREIAAAEERLSGMESEIFQGLVRKVLEFLPGIRKSAEAIAELDLLCSFAQVARERRFSKPEVDLSGSIEIEEGRHPVVEASLGPGEFVPNDTRLGGEEAQICIITGPNMAGKSTYLRQVGMIVLMAHMGSFVPAERARIGLVDRIFTRIGAADDIASGRSTFLVEMNETASILKNITSRSLVLLDELGRGTSTYDGISIAWAVVEYLHDYSRHKPKTLFATHYHELTELAERHARVQNLTVLVKEHGDKVVFLRKIRPGSADRSYGIYVASLAGLPEAVIERAGRILADLEAMREERARLCPGDSTPVMQLRLFEPASDGLIRELEKIDPARITPLEALKLIDSWRRKYGSRAEAARGEGNGEGVFRKQQDFGKQEPSDEAG